MKRFPIGSKVVGEGEPTLIVAELSANHGGSLETALATVDMAAACGADAIKLQTYTPDTLTLKSSAPRFVVKTNNEWSGRTLHDLYAEAMTPWEWHAPLFERAAEKGLLCFSTPFDATAVEFLEDLGAVAYKVASFELCDLPLVERVARTQKPVIMSTGMASLGEIEAAVRACRDAGNEKIVLLRCVSAYPADPASMNLGSLETLRAFGTIVGLSDHTREPTAAICAVAHGARVLEKHVILRRDVGGPDAFFSLEPAELEATVKAVRSAEAAMGPPRFGPAADESASVAFRRSLFVARDVPEGRVVDCDDVRSVRPHGGLAPKMLPEVLGRTARRPLSAGTPLSWEMLGPNENPTGVRLRPAAADDAAVLLAWRNDEATRAMSVSQVEVSAAEHAGWLKASLASEERHLFIASNEARPVGQVRLDARTPKSFEVSITVAPEVRGQGFSWRMLRAAEDAARALGALHLEARIRPENHKSVRAFKRAGYYGFATSAKGGGPMLRCERRLTAYA